MPPAKKKKDENLCPCCKRPLPPYGTMPWHKDEFAEVFRIWVHYHRLIFDMNGAGTQGAYLTASWQELFRIQMNPLPTAEELKEASQWMIADENLCRAAWATHYAFIRGRINRGRRAIKDAEEKRDKMDARDKEERIKQATGDKPGDYEAEFLRRNPNPDAEAIERAKAKVFKSI